MDLYDVRPYSPTRNSRPYYRRPRIYPHTHRKDISNSPTPTVIKNYTCDYCRAYETNYSKGVRSFIAIAAVIYYLVLLSRSLTMIGY